MSTERIRHRFPAYCLQKKTGRAYVRLNGRVMHFLGAYRSEESFVKYGEIVAMLAEGLARSGAVDADSVLGPTINELWDAYHEHCKEYYVKNGKVTDEVSCIKGAVEPLLKLYGTTYVAAFGPEKLTRVRKQMIDGYTRTVGKGANQRTVKVTRCRRYINQSVNRICRMVDWGVQNRGIDAAVLHNLQAVPTLRRGQYGVKDHPSRRPISEENLKLIAGAVPPMVCDMIELMMHTGMKPGEVVSLTGEMIIQIPGANELAILHPERREAIAVDANARVIIERYSRYDAKLRLFRMSRAVFSRNISDACKKLGLPVYTGFSIRHTYAATLRAKGGFDTAQAGLAVKRESMKTYDHLPPEAAVRALHVVEGIEFTSV